MTRTTARKRRTKSDHICERLRADIVSATGPPGERLASVRALSQRFGASISTVHQALRQLGVEGYVETRHGSGTVVASRHRPITMADTVALCMPARGHLWSDLAALLMELLADRGRLGILLGLEGQHGTGEEMVRRLAHSESRTVIVQAGSHFPFAVFDAPGMRRKTVIAVVAWCSPMQWPGLYRVLPDREAAARLVADHLRARGHRHVLILGTPSQAHALATGNPLDDSPGAPFARRWKEGGGRWSVLASQPTQGAREMCLDGAALFGFLDGPEPPTAAFACRDYEAWLAQGRLLRRRPELLARFDIVGHGNTPWSEAAQPPFTTVDLRLERIADEAMRILDRLAEGELPTEALVSVPPRLIVRGGT